VGGAAEKQAGLCTLGQRGGAAAAAGLQTERMCVYVCVFMCSCVFCVCV
jgi:hypothetical protein